AVFWRPSWSSVPRLLSLLDWVTVAVFWRPSCDRRPMALPPPEAATPWVIVATLPALLPPPVSRVWRTLETLLPSPPCWVIVSLLRIVDPLPISSSCCTSPTLLPSDDWVIAALLCQPLWSNPSPPVPIALPLPLWR